jgi:hypothetical protein
MKKSFLILLVFASYFLNAQKVTIELGGGSGGTGVEVDPIYSGSLASQIMSVGSKSIITTTERTNYNTAFSWGNHAGLYRPISYVPTFEQVLNAGNSAGSNTIQFNGNGGVGIGLLQFNSVTTTYPIIAENIAGDRLAIQTTFGGTTTTRYTFPKNSVIAQSTDVLTKAFWDANYGGGGSSPTGNETVFNAWDKNASDDWTTSNFSSTNVSNWNTAFSWGGHAGLYAPISTVSNATHTGHVTGATTLTIQPGVVTNSMLAGSIALSKLANGTANRIFWYNASGAPSELILGSNLSVVGSTLNASGGGSDSQTLYMPSTNQLGISGGNVLNILTQLNIRKKQTGGGYANDFITASDGFIEFDTTTLDYETSFNMASVKKPNLDFSSSEQNTKTIFNGKFVYCKTISISNIANNTTSNNSIGLQIADLLDFVFRYTDDNGKKVQSNYIGDQVFVDVTAGNPSNVRILNQSSFTLTNCSVTVYYTKS